MRLQIDKHILCHQLINRIAAVQHETNIESEAFFWRYDIHPSSTPLFDILFLDRVTPAMAVVIPLAKPTYLGSAKAWRIVKVLNHLPIRRTSQIISKNWDFLMNKSLERNNEISHLWRNVAASRAWKNGTMAHLPQICIRRLPNGLNFWNFTAKTWAKRSITNNQQAKTWVFLLRIHHPKSRLSLELASLNPDLRVGVFDLQTCRRQVSSRKSRIKWLDLLDLLQWKARNKHLIYLNLVGTKGVYHRI